MSNEKCDKDLIDILSSSSSSSSIDSSLDFSSENFDPKKALYSSKLKLKVKNFKKYDNLAKFETALVKYSRLDVGKQGDPSIKSLKLTENSVGGPSTSALTPSSSSSFTNYDIERRFLPHQRPIQGRIKGKNTRNLLTKIERYEGPLGTLRDLMDKGRKIIVYTRKEHGVRGTITGHLVCFDRHWNLLLTDVVETWKRRKYKFSENKTICGNPEDCEDRLKKLGIKIPKTEVKSLNRKYVECTRKVNQIMIRGEQVVLVSVAALAADMKEDEQEKEKKKEEIS